MAERTVAAGPRQGEKSENGTDGTEVTRAHERYFAPPVDIFESQDGLTVVADLPGVNRDGLSVEVTDDILTLKAQAQSALPGNPIYKEFELVNFYRQFQLADSVDASKITAELRHGVLTLNLPKAEQAKPKRIVVAVG